MFNSCAVLATYSGAQNLHVDVVLLSLGKKRVRASTRRARFLFSLTSYVLVPLARKIMQMAYGMRGR